MKKFNRVDTLAVLLKVKPGLAAKDIIEEMTHYLFTGSDVIAYNDRICVQHPLETDFICSVDASVLESTLTKMKTKEVEIGIVKEKDKEELVIKNSKAKVHCAIMKDHMVFEKVANLSTDFEDDPWKSLPNDFVSGARLASYAASKDESAGTATCIRVEGNTILAGDVYRCSKYDMEEEMDSFMIKAQALESMASYSFADYCITDSWAHFLTEDDVVFSTRVISGNFLPFDKVMEKFEGEEFPLPDDLSSSIDIASIMADDTHGTVDQTIHIFINDGKLTCEGSKEEGHSRSVCAVDYDGDPIEFLINPNSLLEALKRGSLMYLGEDRAVFSSESFKHLLMFKV